MMEWFAAGIGKELCSVMAWGRVLVMSTAEVCFS